jgi:hypothetical protein
MHLLDMPVISVQDFGQFLAETIGQFLVETIGQFLVERTAFNEILC